MLVTRTTTFTERLGAAFAFAVLASILVDIAVALNVWRVSDQVLPGVGCALAALVVVGGLVFDIGTAPVTLLVLAGGFDGLILPIGFVVVLWVAWRRRDLLGRYPAWSPGIGVLSWLLTLYLGYGSLGGPASR